MFNISGKDYPSFSYGTALLPPDGESYDSKNDQPKHTVLAESFITRHIMRLAEKEREYIGKELEHVFCHTFNVMAESDWSQFVACFFKDTAQNFSRHTLFFRKPSGEMISATVFDHGDFEYQGRCFQGIHMIVTAILPEYQALGLGHQIGKTVLEKMAPDVLFSTCSQSPMLHSRIGLVKKGFVSGYEVFPRFKGQNLITVPFTELDFAVRAFQHTYLGYCDGKQKKLDKAIQNLTVLMARKEIGMTFDFHSWKKEGREDGLAKALGINEKDGVLVMFRKQGLFSLPRPSRTK